MLIHKAYHNPVPQTTQVEVGWVGKRPLFSLVESEAKKWWRCQGSVQDGHEGKVGGVPAAIGSQLGAS